MRKFIALSISIEDSFTGAVTTITADSEELKNEVLTVYLIKNPNAKYIETIIDGDKKTTTVIYKLTNTSTFLTITEFIFDFDHCEKCKPGQEWATCTTPEGQTYNIDCGRTE